MPPLILGALFLAGLSFLTVSAAAAPSTVNVTITSSGFKPDPMTVVIGTNNTVTWTNTLNSTQNVVPDLSDPDQNWGSPPLSQGQSYTFTFTIPGTYGYNDGYTTSYIGTVNVLPNPHPTSTTTTSASQTTTVPVTTTTTMPTTTSSPASSGGGVPEFPLAGAAVGVLSILVVFSYLLTRQAVRGTGTRRL